MDDGEKIVSESVPQKKAKSDDLLASYYTTTSIPVKYKLTEMESYRVMHVRDQDRDENPIAFGTATRVRIQS